MQPNLSFEQAPALSVPLRFFLAAPWFGVLAGLLAAMAGEQAIATRWSPVALALTHLLTLGFMFQAMIGALFQFVPVAAGGNVWRPRAVAALVHPVTIVAALSLTLGFLIGAAGLLRLAAGLLSAAALVLISVVGTAVLRTPARGATIMALRLAVGGLAITVLLGAGLAEGLAGGHPWPLAALTDVHAAWGLGAWSLTLLVGVSYFVVPMFQLTPPYPQRIASWLPPALLTAVLAWSLQLLDFGATQPILLAGLGLAALYAVVTLDLQRRRRRRVTDPTLWFFRGAMICLVAAFVSALWFAAAPAVGESAQTSWWLGVLLLPGLFVSAINGMLYKIVPFLGWLHLQRLIGLGGTPPNMREMIGERTLWWQMSAHFVAVILLLAATFWPQLVGVAGASFALSCAWLGLNLGRAVRVYCRFKARIAANASSPAP